jgi:hypothetical protein
MGGWVGDGTSIAAALLAVYGCTVHTEPTTAVGKVLLAVGGQLL